MSRDLELTVLVYFDPLAGVVISIGGNVGAGCVAELCEAIERSVTLAHRRARVDLTSALVADDALEQLRQLCGQFAEFTPPTSREPEPNWA
ncbi:hypothetical protein [Pengzhenrongella sp.]|jgi:hypothetical protein|uniref:hypothetical protein n=1 Tax=Pengzhenrongella sp. TaxID=2888820 RepID=UPI002F957AA7